MAICNLPWRLAIFERPAAPAGIRSGTGNATHWAGTVSSFIFGPLYGALSGGNNMLSSIHYERSARQGSQAGHPLIHSFPAVPTTDILAAIAIPLYANVQ